MRVLAVALMTLFLAGPSLGQSLSKQNLVDLKKASVADAVVIKQIEKDGISFEMNASATIELKNLGFSDDVLSALLTASNKKSLPSAADPIKALYSQGKYGELCDYLKGRLEKNPADYRSRTILIGALLRLNQRPAALVEYEKLKTQSQDAAAKDYVDRASTIMSSWQKQEETKAKFVASLRNLDLAAAKAEIEQFSASESQRAILRMHLDAYAGQFDAAREQASRLKGLSFSDKERMDAALKKLDDSEAAYVSLMNKAELYLHSPVIPSLCQNSSTYFGKGQKYGDMAQLSLQEYGDAVTSLARQFPLDAKTMDLIFHLSFLTSDSASVVSLGDRILAAKGQIRIPFYARDRYFNVVIDARQKKIYTEPDSHPFSVRYAWNGGWSLKKDVDHNDYNADVVPFDLPFDQIRGLSQKGRNRTGTQGLEIVSKSYALSFEPTGVAPNYALMHFIFCTGGESAELGATRNLGEFVLHAIGNPALKADLADPSKAHRPDSGFSAALLAMTAQINHSPLAAYAANEMAAMNAQQRTALQEQEDNWIQVTSKDYSDLLDGNVFDDLDKLVEVL